MKKFTLSMPHAPCYDHKAFPDLDYGLVTELQLIVCLNKAHPKCPHVQEPLLDVDSLRARCLSLQETRVHEDKGARAPNSGGAVDHSGPRLALEAPGLPDRAQELQEGVRAARHAEVWPGGVVEVEHLPRLVLCCTC